MEPVRELSIGGSCAAVAVGEKRKFVANIRTGKPVSFLWTFDLHHHNKESRMGKEVRALFNIRPSLMTRCNTLTVSCAITVICS